MGPFTILPPDDTTSLSPLTDALQPLMGAHPRVERYLNEGRFKNYVEREGPPDDDRGQASALSACISAFVDAGLMLTFFR